MFTNNAEIILASGSPRRRRFLEELGLDFTVQVADVDESVSTDESPEEFVRRLSLEKARFIAEDNQEVFVIGADTVVVLDDKILGKPEDPSDAMTMLKTLAGRTHEVWTGFTILKYASDVSTTEAIRTEVTFVETPDDVLSAYVGSGEPLDKAVAYGIQGRGGILVKKIDGSYSNVVGLPMVELVSELLFLGAIKPQT